MNHLTKGALTMVLAGSVTFSIANAWLGGQPAKQLLEKVNAIAHSELQKKANFLNYQADQSVKGQAPKTGIKDVQTTSSHNTATVQAVIKKENKSNHSITAAKQTPKIATDRVTTPPAKKVTTSSASSSQPTVVHTANTSSSSSSSSKASKTVPKTTAAATTSSTHTHPSPNVHAASSSTKASTQNTTAKATTNYTTSNHGQQVSQIQREKNATNAANKTNNGKKM